MSARRFAILDRDGTIIHEKRYLDDPAQVELLPGAAAGLRALSAAGLGLIVITNQSGLGRGYFDRPRLDAIHDRLVELLAAESVSLDAIYVCPHVPDDGCECRKPGVVLLTQAAQEHGFAPGDCLVLGDKACDIEMGRRAGATTFLTRTGYGAELEASGYDAADYVVNDVAEGAEIIAATLARGALPPGRNLLRPANGAKSLLPNTRLQC